MINCISCNKPISVNRVATVCICGEKLPMLPKKKKLVKEKVHTKMIVNKYQLLNMSVKNRRNFFRQLGRGDVNRLGGANKKEYVLNLYNGKCGICGERLELSSMTLDHIFPRSLGGTLCIDNCQPAHLCCNLIKGDTYPFLLSYDEVKNSSGYDVTKKHKKVYMVSQSREEVIKEYKRLGFIIC